MPLTILIWDSYCYSICISFLSTWYQRFCREAGWRRRWEVIFGGTNSKCADTQKPQACTTLQEVSLLIETLSFPVWNELGLTHHSCGLHIGHAGTELWPLILAYKGNNIFVIIYHDTWVKYHLFRPNDLLLSILSPQNHNQAHSPSWRCKCFCYGSALWALILASSFL